MSQPTCDQCGATLQEARVDGERVLRCPWSKPDGSHAGAMGGFSCEYRPAYAREVSGEFLRGSTAPQRGSR